MNKLMVGDTVWVVIGERLATDCNDFDDDSYYDGVIGVYSDEKRALEVRQKVSNVPEWDYREAYVVEFPVEGPST